MNNASKIWTRLFLPLIIVAGSWLIYRTVTERPPHRGPMPPPGQEILLAGEVQAYGSNHEGDIDKISLLTGQGTFWLHFPPHTARQVTRNAPLHAKIEVNAARHSPPGPGAHGPEAGRYELIKLRNPAMQSEAELTGIPPPAPSPGTDVEITGSTRHDFASGAGQDHAFTLAGKQISLPPHMARELLPLIGRAENIVVTGKMRNPEEGFVSASGLPVVKATLIRLDSVYYKIR